jgi:hypothetical protein
LSYLLLFPIATVAPCPHPTINNSPHYENYLIVLKYFIVNRNSTLYKFYKFIENYRNYLYTYIKIKIHYTMSATSSPQSSHSRSTSVETTPRPGISQALRNLFGPSLSAEAGKNPSPVPSASAPPSEGHNVPIFNARVENKEEFVDAREPPAPIALTYNAAPNPEQFVFNSSVMAGRKRHCPYSGVGDNSSTSPPSVAQLAAELSTLRTQLVQQIAQVEDNYLVQITELENRIPAAIDAATRPLLERIAALEANNSALPKPNLPLPIESFSFSADIQRPQLPKCSTTSLPPRPPRGWRNSKPAPQNVRPALPPSHAPIFGLLPKPIRVPAPPTNDSNIETRKSRPQKTPKTRNQPQTAIHESKPSSPQATHETILQFADAKDDWKDPKLAETVLKAVNEKMFAIQVPRFLRARFISPWSAILLSSLTAPASSYEQHNAAILSSIATIGSARVKPSVPTRRVIIHGLPCNRSMADMSRELTDLYPIFKISTEPRWLTPEDRRAGKTHSSAVVTVDTAKRLSIEQEGGIYLFNNWCRVTSYQRIPPKNRNRSSPIASSAAPTVTLQPAMTQEVAATPTAILPPLPATSVISNPDSEMTGASQY